MNHRQLYPVAIIFGLLNPACAGEAFSSAPEFSAVGGQSTAVTSSGGGTHVAGQSAAGGRSTVVTSGGRDTSVGGHSVAMGGNENNGGTATVAGSSNVGAVNSPGGTSATGGNNGTLEQHQTGGKAAMGGSQSTGGLPSTGGLQSTGGKSATGGLPSTGGLQSTGGKSATGGSQSTGGKSATGGSQSTGGTSSSSSGWTCNVAYYGTNDGCDCGCGVIDPDCGNDASRGVCRSGNEENACSHAGGWGWLAISNEDNALCIVAPSGWTCAPIYYGDGTCHCGCGITDSDCFDEGGHSCERCGSPGSCAPYDWSSTCNAIDPADNSKCIDMVQVPVNWTCAPSHYDADDGCNCGCGVTDPDCGGTDLELCDRCTDEGACSYYLGDCHALSATDNSKCASGAWTCDPATYNAGDGCNCGCGLFDPDCESDRAVSCELCADQGSCSRSCADIAPNDNKYCILSSTG